MALELEKETNSGKHDKQTEKLMLKLAKGFKELSAKMVIEVKKLDQCDFCEDKS